MKKIDVFRQAVLEFGEASAEELSKFIEVKYGVLIPPPHIPIFRATLRHRKDALISECRHGAVEQQ